MYILLLGVMVLGVGQKPDMIKGAKAATLRGEYDVSLSRLKDFKPTGETYNEYCYLMAVNYFALNDKANAAKWLGFLSDSFEKLDRRHRSMAYLMMEDLGGWKDGDLADVGRDMRISKDRLASARGGVETQQIQKRIVDKLDKLIKEQEDKQTGGGGGKKESEQKPGQQGGLGQPAVDSVVMGVSGKGKVDERQLRRYAEQWGSLPPEKRASVVAEVTRDLPPKYKQLVDDYFKSLNRRHPR